MKEENEPTGTAELPAVVGALFDTLDDKSEDVKNAVIESIRRISKENSIIIIHTGIYFWELHKKMPLSHLISLLNVLTETCRDYSSQLDTDLASSIAELAINELRGDAKKEAGELTVAIARVHPIPTMGALLLRLEPSGELPMDSILHTIGMVAAANPLGVIPFVKVTLNYSIPMLQRHLDENLKLSFCFMLGKLCEAIKDSLLNVEKDADNGISKDAFREEVTSVFETLIYGWMRNMRDQKLIEGILSAVGSMLTLLPEDLEGERIGKLLPILLNLSKKSNTRLAATRLLAILLNHSTVNDKESLRPFLENLQQILFEFVSIAPFEASRDSLLTHYEVLQCSRALVVLYPEEGLDRILQQLKSPVASHRARSLVVLRHLINTLPAEDDATLQRIALSLQESLNDGVSRQMVGAIVALSARPSIPLLPSQRAAFVRYMVTNCGSKSEETEPYGEALYLLATTVEGAENWLWSSLLRALLDPACTASAVPVLRALTPLSAKVTSDDGKSSLGKDFRGTKVLARCLELLGNEKNRPSVVTFLRSSAPLLGHQLKPQWDEKLLELSRFLEEEYKDKPVESVQRVLLWEERIVEFLEESVQLEGEAWGQKLADELVGKISTPGTAALLAAVTNNPSHVTLLVELARTHAAQLEYSRAIGFSAKRHLELVLKLLEESSIVEDHRKLPVRLLGLMKDAKAAATAEASKSGLLRSYAEVARRGDAEKLFENFERHVVRWIIRQLGDGKEVATKEAALVALEQVAGAVHPNRLPGSSGLKARGTALASLLALLQTPSGHRPLLLYPFILKATIALLRVPPVLTNEERDILLSTMLDKTIAASTEIASLFLPDIMQQVVEGLGTVCSEVVSDSADALAELADIILPWMQSKSPMERRMALLVLRTTLRSYHDSLKYTYPEGKLEPGKLLGRILCWSADPENALRPLVVDCVALSLSIGARHRSTLPDNNLDQDLSESKRIIISDDPKILYDGVENLARAVCERVPAGEVVSLAEGLIEGLLYRGEGGLAAGIALAQHFKIRGHDIPRSSIYLIDNIIGQMKHMENISCRRGAANAVKSLMAHYPQEVMEHLLHQPLPLDHGTEECWRELGTDEVLGLQILQLLLTRLDNDNVLSESNAQSSQPGKHPTAAFSSLVAIIALGHLLQSSNSEVLIEKQLAGLLSTLLKYLSGWLYVDAPISIVSTKFGFVPNRESGKLNPHREVYSVLINILTAVNSNVASSLLNESSIDSNIQAEEGLISTVRSVVRCLCNKNDVLSSMTQSLGKLVTSPLAAQRAVATALYTELIGRVDCGPIWLDAIVNTLHEAKADSSPFVRKLATIGLTRIAYLDTKQMNEYFDSCMAALLNGLEESVTGEGGTEIVLESLRGLSILLSTQVDRPITPRVVMSLKPFVEKENQDIRLAAINALGAIVRGWQKSVSSPDDDITNHLFGCLPCLVIRLEDSHTMVVKAVKETLCEAANLLQCAQLALIIRSHLSLHSGTFNLESFLRDLIRCLHRELPQRAEELRNAVVRGYSRSENAVLRGTSALILGLYGHPGAEEVQRMLQLLRDTESMVRSRAARALSLSFTE